MKWVTRNYVHLDRVASPWLIKRFVDPQAEFVFVDWGKESDRPADAIPFGMTGVELGSHDANGTTFEKILAKYALTDPALQRLGQVIARGVDHALHGYQPPSDDVEGQIAIGLLAYSEGALLCAAADMQIIEAAYPVYDALHANFKVQAMIKTRGLKLPTSSTPGPGEKFRFLRDLFNQPG